MQTQATLHRLEGALDWAREDPAEHPCFIFAMVDDWDDFDRIEADDWTRLAVTIDDKDYFGDEMRALSVPGALADTNPSVIIFRVQEAETRKRLAAAFVLAQKGLDVTTIKNAIGYGVADPAALARVSAALRASVENSASSRHAGREP